VEDLLDKAEQKLFKVSQKFLKASFTAIQDVLDDAFERIDELHREKGKMRGTPSGYTDLDELLGGLQKRATSSFSPLVRLAEKLRSLSISPVMRR
jgi:replicative DNA helicase